MSTIVITGANRGIGLQLAKQFSERGDKVIAGCRRTSDGLSQLDLRIETGLDVTSDEAVSDFAKRIEDVEIDILVNNAGLLEFDTLHALDFESIRRQFEVNSLGPLRVSSMLRKRMKRGSKLVILTSRMGSIADNSSGGMYGYRASKCAVNMFASALAVDLVQDEIAVAVLHPGFVRTDMTRGNGNVDPDEAARGLINRIDALAMETSGYFWHAQGQILPW